jgi:hypothetical protein
MKLVKKRERQIGNLL